MYFIRRILLVFIAPLYVAGCASIDRPELISEDTLPLNVLTEAITCELKTAVKEQVAENKWLLNWQGQYSITLKANQIAFAKLGASTFPAILSKTALLNFGVAGGYTSTANKTALFKFNINFQDVAAQPQCLPQFRANGHPFLTGEIGFRDWMRRAILASGNQSDKNNPDKLSSIGHTFEFSIDINGSVSPSFVINPMPSVIINPSASFDRVEDNIVDVSFGKIPTAAATVADIAKILSPAQNKKIAQEQRKEKDSVKNAQRAFLTMSETVANLSSLDQEIAKNLDTGEVLNSKGESDRKQNLEKLRAERQRVQTQKAAADSESKLADAEAAAARARIAQIKANPEITRSTTRQVPIPQVALSPEANPNVTNTLLQLQLERLITAGVPVR